MEEIEFDLTPEAASLMEAGGPDNTDDDDLMDFAERISCSDGFWYGLVHGGYIRPHLILSNPAQLDELEAAIHLVSAFEDIWNQISIEQ